MRVESEFESGSFRSHSEVCGWICSGAMDSSVTIVWALFGQVEKTSGERKKVPFCAAKSDRQFD
jgi:hypothetical protein